jgi:hypothetical protein
MEINQLDYRFSIVDCWLSNFDMKSFQNIAKPSEAKKNINDNFYFLWNSFLQRLSKMITKSLPQQSFCHIISIEKRSKRFGMNWHENENECRNELDCWFLILFDFRTKLSQNGNVCWCKWRKRRHRYMENTFIQYYSISISISIEIFASRVPWRWRYCKSKQCSNDNFPTFAKPSEVKENTNEQFHSLS